MSMNDTNNGTATPTLPVPATKPGKAPKGGERVELNGVDAILHQLRNCTTPHDRVMALMGAITFSKGKTSIKSAMGSVSIDPLYTSSTEHLASAARKGAKYSPPELTAGAAVAKTSVSVDGDDAEAIVMALTAKGNELVKG